MGPIAAERVMEGAFEQGQIADLALYCGGSCGHKAAAEAVAD